jgi:peptidoglycan/LPS O-acetylase OafA/YrhL
VTATSRLPAATAPGTAPSPALAPPPGNPRFPLFDSLRGLAVLAVLYFHAALFTGQLDGSTRGDVAMVLGAQGPTLFFVISGFLLYRPFAAAHADGRPGPGLARYARRRALRILPAYWVALTVLAAFPGIVGVFSLDWWRYYGFLQLYSARTLGLGIPPAWTLCVEVAFYAALPLWAALLGWLTARRRGRWALLEIGALVGLIAGGLAVQLAASRLAVPYLLGQSAVGQSAWLGLGMLLAAISVTVERAASEPGLIGAVRRHPGLCWAVALAAFAGLTALTPGGGIFALVAASRTRVAVDTELARLALTGVLCAALVLPAVFTARRGLPVRLLGSRPMAGLGLISYGVYLWHLTIIGLLALPRDPGHYAADVGLDLVGRIGMRTSTPVVFVLALLGSTLVAAVSYRWVELPFLRRKERAGVRAPRRSAAPRG